MKKTILILLGLGVMVGIGIAYYQFTKTYDDTSDLKTDYVLQADELLSEFLTNEEQALEKYKGKIIEVTGEISNVDVASATNSNIFLGVKGEIDGISCNVEQNAEVLSLQKGQKITIKGECSGYLSLSGVILIRCIIKN